MADNAPTGWRLSGLGGLRQDLQQRAEQFRRLSASAQRDYLADPANAFFREAVELARDLAKYVPLLPEDN